jgi:hypothetical protein
MPDRFQLIHEALIENPPEENQEKIINKIVDVIPENNNTKSKILDILKIIFLYLKKLFIISAYFVCVIGVVYSFFTASFLAGIFYVLGLMLLQGEK